MDNGKLCRTLQASLRANTSTGGTLLNGTRSFLSMTKEPVGKDHKGVVQSTRCSHKDKTVARVI